MEIIGRFFQKERNYYNKISSDGQRLLASILLYNILSPLLGIFINAFIWRESHNVELIAFYNLVLFIGIVLGFYWNGLLLRKFPASLLYTFGALLQGLSVALIIFLQINNLITLSLFGFLFGIAGGVFWANRNLLTLKTTNTDNRIYFSSIESNLGTATDIVIPVLIGWFIVAGQASHLYTPLQAYQYLSVAIIIIVVFIGIVLNRLMIKLPPPKQLTIHSVSTRWKKFQTFEFFLGFLGGTATFIPVLMVLILVGNENVLGSIQSISSLIAIILISLLAKSLKITHRIKLFVIYTILGIIAAGAFSVLYSPLGVYIYYALSAITVSLSWIAVNSLNYDLIDEEDQELHYAYVCDQEIYLNGGRIVSIILFILLAAYSSGFAIRFMTFIAALSQIFLIFIAKSIEKRK